jgi:putative restriction endonuclease
MTRRPWSHDELMLAMNLYCQLPFGKLHHRNRDVTNLAGAIDRTPSSVAMKLCNLASLDPVHQQRGIRGLSKVSAADISIWDEFHADWNRSAAESESLRDRVFSAIGSTTVADELESSEDAIVASEYVGETEVVRQQKVRLAQRFFRRSVLSSHDFRCCITQIGMRPLLIASHIVP